MSERAFQYLIRQPAAAELQLAEPLQLAERPQEALWDCGKRSEAEL